MTDGFSALDKMKEAEREVAMRRAVYPKWTASGRMKPAEAEMRIACMQSIAEDYKALAKLKETERT